MRTLEELVCIDEPAMPLVREWVAAASNPVELLPCEGAQGERTLLALQVTTHSPMGAIAHGAGGLLVDGGWLRILGAGCPRLPRGLADWNGLAEGATPRLAGALLIGDDAVGGFFALNGGGLEGPVGQVCYLAPDTLRWERLDFGCSEWLDWACTGDLDRFYERLRWPGWRGEVAALDGARALSVYPFLWAAGPPIAERSRRPVPIDELWRLAMDFRQQFGWAS